MPSASRSTARRTGRRLGLRARLDGTSFTVRSPLGTAEVELPLRGRFNAANALVAMACCAPLGLPLDKMAEALADARPVPGRVQAVDEGQDFAVLVDYAHKPGALEKVLASAREVATGRVVVVFGAGGDRDTAKRPVMGEIAARMADAVIVTSDNPRSEDPEAIVAAIIAGVPSGSFHVKQVVDRREAIGAAIADAAPGDVVVIAGKGHEQGQEFAGGRKEPFDDVAVARDALRAVARA